MLFKCSSGADFVKSSLSLNNKNTLIYRNIHIVKHQHHTRLLGTVSHHIIYNICNTLESRAHVFCVHCLRIASQVNPRCHKRLVEEHPAVSQRVSRGLAYIDRNDSISYSINMHKTETESLRAKQFLWSKFQLTCIVEICFIFSLSRC